MNRNKAKECVKNKIKSEGDGEYIVDVASMDN